MEKPKPAQNHEQERPKTLEDYAVKTFPADLDVTIRPLTVIRSGKDGGGIRDDEGWTPGDMLCVRKEGIGSIELFVKVHKLIKVYGEHVYEECVPITKIVSLKKLQSREENKGFNEFYIQELYGKSTEEMIEEGERAAEQISNSSVVEEGGSDLERPKVSLKIGSTAVEAAGIEKPADLVATESVKKPVEADKASAAPAGLPAVESAKKPVETGRVSISPSTLVMSKKVLESIGAVKVDDSVGSPAIKSAAVKELAKNLAVASAKELVVDSIKNPAVKLAKKPAKIDKVDANPADLVATEPVKKPVEADKASADLVDLPAAKSVENPVAEKSMETIEANADILPEDFKDTINSFERATNDNNDQFFEKAKNTTGELNQLRGLIKDNPAAMNNPAISEMITSTSGRIRDLEASRSESVNKFKNNMNSLLEDLKSEIENEDEKRRRLVKLTEHVDQMGEDNKVLGNTTNDLLDKLIRIRRYIEEWQNDRWGANSYKSNISQVIGEIISDLSTASGRRQNIVDGIKRIKSEGYYQER